MINKIREYMTYLFFMHKLHASEKFCNTGKKGLYTRFAYCDKELLGYNCRHGATECNFGKEQV